MMDRNVVLGLGSNVGDRKTHLKSALESLAQVVSNLKVSSIYQSDAQLLDGAPADWQKPFFNIAVSASYDGTPQDLMVELKKIEQKLGRANRQRWSPRIIDIDILDFAGNPVAEDNLKIPHGELLSRPFALLPFAEIEPEWKLAPSAKQVRKSVIEWTKQWDGEVPFHTQALSKGLGMNYPQLVGILNITPDSFSDGNHFFATDKAVQQSIKMMADGATLIDVGAESTRPGARAVSPDEEWNRLQPVLLELKKQNIPFSVDTRHFKTAEKSIELGCKWINDVSGLRDARIQRLATLSDCDFVFMHSVTVPADREAIISTQEDPVRYLIDWCKKKLQKFNDVGIPTNRLIFDPGVGFGKNADQSWQMIKRANEWQEVKDLGLRVLIGHSRKSFLNTVTDQPFADRDLETTITSLQLTHPCIDYLRVHNVEMHRRAFAVANV